MREVDWISDWDPADAGELTGVVLGAAVPGAVRRGCETARKFDILIVR